MNRLVILLFAALITSSSFAQKDSAAYNSDTVRVGNFVIIKKIKVPLKHRPVFGMIGTKQ